MRPWCVLLLSEHKEREIVDCPISPSPRLDCTVACVYPFIWLIKQSCPISCVMLDKNVLRIDLITLGYCDTAHPKDIPDWSFAWQSWLIICMAFLIDHLFSQRSCTVTHSWYHFQSHLFISFVLLNRRSHTEQALCEPQGQGRIRLLFFCLKLDATQDELKVTDGYCGTFMAYPGSRILLYWTSVWSVSPLVVRISRVYLMVVLFLFIAPPLLVEDT
jgi:hypothetical protein